MPGFLSLALRAKRLRCVPARPGERGSVVRILFHAAFSSLELHAVRCQTLVNFWREKKDDTTWTPFPFVVFNLSSDGRNPAPGERGACRGPGHFSRTN